MQIYPVCGKQLYIVILFLLFVMFLGKFIVIMPPVSLLNQI